MNRAHLVPFALAFVAGVASDVCNVALPVLFSGVASAMLVRAVPRVVRANILGALAAGVLYAHTFAHAPPLASDLHFARFTATVVDARSEVAERNESVVRLADGAFATLSLPGTPLPIGTRLVVRAKRTVFDDARNPGEPSPRALEAERGILWHLARARVVERAAPDTRDPSLWIPRARAWASARLHATLGEPDATILAGAMWGERGPLPPDLRAEFQDTGTVHVLVTAGLHLGVVAALAVALLQWLRCGRVAASLGAIVVVWSYAAFSGAHLPSLRAATMLSFALLARASGREALSWNALAAAAIVVAALRPASVPSVSFALSFSCVAAIFAFASPLAHRLERTGLPPLACGALAVSLAAQLGTWPLTAAAFLVVAPYAPLANVLVVPVVGVAMLVGFVALAASSIAPLAFVAANVETSLVDWIVGAVRFVGSLPGAHVIATPPPPWTIVAYDLACVLAALAIAQRRIGIAIAHRPIGIAFAIAAVAAASALCLWPPRAASRDLVITAVDVGQADAILIRTPRGHAYLVDAGGRLERGLAQSGTSAAEDIGARIVVPFLVRSGVHHLDGVLLSHPHGDHAGGLAPVLQSLGANAFADSGQTYPGHAYQAALDAAREKHVPMLEPRAGDVWRTDDGVTFRFYGPALPYLRDTRNDINSNSLVFRLEYDRFRMLFTGDAGAETEQRLIEGGFDLRAKVLKVGHHGSSYGTTPEFVRDVGASDAIISVGRNNLFGHPAPATLATLRAGGLRIHRTDVQGSVTVKSNGSAFSIEEFLAPR